MSLVLASLVAYLVGALPVSYYIAKRFGKIDLRTRGSGNLGATNLYRVLGWRYAYPAAAADILKGFLPVFLFTPDGPDWSPLVVGGAAVAGHVFPIYLRFRGGKGVATAAGVVLAIAPLALLASAIVWGAALATTRTMSVASLLGALSFPLAVWLIRPQDRILIIASVLIAAFLMFTHRENLKRLFRGTEPRLASPGEGRG